DTIQAIGWGSYILALVILVVLAPLLFSVIISLLALIPLVGWVIQLILNPLISIFSARFICRVYDHSIPQAPAPEPAPACMCTPAYFLLNRLPLSLRAQAREYGWGISCATRPGRYACGILFPLK